MSGLLSFNSDLSEHPKDVNIKLKNHQLAMLKKCQDIENIENILLPDREVWFLKLCHTEWLVDEIAKGIPLKRLETSIENLLKSSS